MFQVMAQKQSTGFHVLNGLEVTTIRLQIREEIRRTGLAKDHRSSEIQFANANTTNILANRKRKWQEVFENEAVKKMSEDDFDRFVARCIEQI